MKATYRCLKQQHFHDGDRSIVPLRHQDIQQIKDWRNAQITVLRQSTPLTTSAQETYYRDVVTKSFHDAHPDIILFSYLLQGECIGYGGLVWIDWSLNEAEVSFLLETERANNTSTYKSDFTHFLQLLKQAAFKDIGFKRIYTETYEIRPLHIAILESQGFILEERLPKHVTIDGKAVDALIHGCYR